jgi:hypothetical protein
MISELKFTPQHLEVWFAACEIDTKVWFAACEIEYVVNLIM